MEYALAKLHCVGGAFPSQWDGLTTDGRLVYVRYRWGCLTVNVSRDVGNQFNEDVVFRAQIGHATDGTLSTAEMLHAVGRTLLPPRDFHPDR
jgi:hypothetical protein